MKKYGLTPSILIYTNSGLTGEIDKESSYVFSLLTKAFNYLSKLIKVEAEPMIDLAYLLDSDIDCGGFEFKGANMPTQHEANFILIVGKTNKY